MLTQVAIGHQRGQQHGQRQRYGHDEHAKVEQQLQQHTRTQILADDIVQVFKQCVREQDKLHYREGEQKRAGKSLQNKLIELF